MLDGNKDLLGIYKYNNNLYIYYNHLSIDINEDVNNINIQCKSNFYDINKYVYDANIKNIKNLYINYSKNRISLKDIKDETEIYIFKIYELFE